LETRFDQFQEFQGSDDFLVRVLAGLVVSQSGFGPFTGVCEATCLDEDEGGVDAGPAGFEAVSHGFVIADRLAVVAEGDVDLPRVGIDESELVVSNRLLRGRVRREHFERLLIVLFGL
jgi:hypothetical protein